MKLLKIENSCGYFLNSKDSFEPIDKITKDDLLRIVDLTLSKEVEFDEYDSDAVKNQAHQILYKSIFEKLNGLRSRKEEFIDESERIYLVEYERYHEEALQQETEGDAVSLKS
ncbi:MAG: hypothetical protein WD595_03685 [Waddliaceae bacterium]